VTTPSAEIPLRAPTASDPDWMRERRAAPRWVPAVPCRARILVDGQTWHAAVEDVSTRGAKLPLCEASEVSALSSGRDVALEIEFGPRTYRLPARIAWQAPGADGVPVFGVEYKPNGEGGDSDIPTVLDVRLVKIDPSWALRIPSSLAMRRRLLPLCEVGGRVQVACADLQDTSALKALERYIDRPLVLQQADPESLTQVLRKIYADARTVSEVEGDEPVALCNELLHAAWLRQASDIHVDPERDGVRVRLRVDGQLEDYRRLPTRTHAELLSRIKVLGGMDIAEKRAAQDGRFTHDVVVGERFEVRVATLPTKHGERATLRLLAIHDDSLTLEKLGMAARDLATSELEIRRPHGLILATGPTGCGKTTTLYAALRRIIGQRSVNAIAVQDPVEYDIPGVAQVEVDAAQKVTFAKALRSILRHDPDVILIGEIRDGETVDIAIKAALTGHLVLATLHTNSAVSAVTRLVDMGADRFLIAATLRMVIAQRLVRRLCPFCRRSSNMNAEQARSLSRPATEGTPIFESGGCVYCAGRGYSGRAGLFELLSMDEALARAVADGCDESRLAQMTRERGMPTIVDDALDKLTGGITSIHEVLAAVAI
jgi:type IV pilus assembly protein PilB